MAKEQEEKPFFTPEEVDLIKRKAVPEGTPANEVDLFLYTAGKLALNPLLNQIYLIKRKKKVKRGDKEVWEEVYTTQTSIDGFRIIADRTKLLRGIERGIRRDEKNCLYAWAKVYRKDWDHPAFEEVSWQEYHGTSTIWARMPETMLKKCAESAALRMAFPQFLSGLYTSEEMSQAEREEKTGPVSLEEIKAAVDAFKAEEAKAKPAPPPRPKLDSETEAQQVRTCMRTINQLATENGLTPEEVEWHTGLKAGEFPTLAQVTQAVNNLIAYVDTKKQIALTSEGQGVLSLDSHSLDTMAS